MGRAKESHLRGETGTPLNLIADLEIQELFEADDPKFENLGPKPARKKKSK